VLALAAEKSEVTGPNVPICHSPAWDADKYTAYDLWIAGVSNQSLESSLTIKQRATNIDICSPARATSSTAMAHLQDGGNLDEGEQGRIDLRRMMHAAAASKDQHFRNYIAIRPQHL